MCGIGHAHLANPSCIKGSMPARKECTHRPCTRSPSRTRLRWGRAEEVQCDNEYITAGVALPSPEWRIMYNNDEHPDTSPAWACNIVSTLNTVDPSGCQASRQDYGYSKLFEGETATAASDTNGLWSEPVAETWRFKYVWVRVKLEADYADGEGMHHSLA